MKVLAGGFRWLPAGLLHGGTRGTCRKVLGGAPGGHRAPRGTDEMQAYPKGDFFLPLGWLLLPVQKLVRRLNTFK